MLNVPTFVKISLQELFVQATDEKWQPKLNSAADNKYFRIIDIKGFSISLNTNKDSRLIYSPYYRYDKKAHQTDSNLPPSFVMDQQSKKGSHTHFEKVRPFMDEAEALEAEYRKLRDRETLLLLPLSFSIRTKKETVMAGDFTFQTSQEFLVDINEPVTLTLSKIHMQYLGGLSQHAKLISIVQKNIHLRPQDLPKEKPSSWWVYAIKSVNEERKRQTKFSRDSANLLRMRKYMDLYKRKQTLVFLIK